MKRVQLSAIYFAITICLISSCKTTLQTERPRESYIPTQPTVTSSEIPLSVDLDVKKLETSLNKKITGVIFEGSDIANKDLKIKVTKAQNFTFNIKNNTLEYRIPIKVWSRFAWKFDKFGISVSDNYEAEGTLALNFRTTITITKNWQLKSKTETIGYQWIVPPKLSVAGIDIPIKPIADLALKQTDAEITQQIDKSLAEAVNLKEYISQAWDLIHEPILISLDDQLWIKTTPKDIYLAPFTSKNNKLNIHLTLYAQIESIIGARPKETQKTKLPEYKIVNKPPQQINLNLLTDVTFEKIAQIAKQQIAGQTFTQAGKNITIKDIDLFASEGKLYFETWLDGAIKGKIYFTGTLNYNAEKNSIEITNPEYDINTKNVLVKSANWLLHGFLLKQIQPHLEYSLTKDLEDAKIQANKSIERIQIINGIQLHGKLNSIQVNKLSLVPGAIRIEANTKGNISIKIDDVEF